MLDLVKVDVYGQSANQQSGYNYNSWAKNNKYSSVGFK